MVADLDERRREAGEVGKKWGQVARTVVSSCGVGEAHGFDVLGREHRVDLRTLCIGLAGHRHVGPRGHQDERAGELAARRLEAVAEYKGEVTARAVAREDDISHVVALEHQIVPRAQLFLFHGQK